jgi:hypothetical protein
MNNKCNVNFQSNFAYLNNECINTIEYVNKYINNNNILKCKNGHELIFVNCKKRNKHFRHKHDVDVGGFPMTEWHCEWQGNFKNTEIDFKKINDLQIKDRRADVLLNELNIILEFQHSKIEECEVNNRMNDYKLHNKDIIWIIDGSESITVSKLNNSNRIYLEFTYDLWKYKSFMNYDYIYIDINSYIYKVYVKYIKNNMIDVELPLKKTDFINKLNNKDDYIYNINIPLQCNLFIKQQGAGNGKTYGLIQMLESNDFLHYKYFIIVTKQHSAKYVIYNEFQQQYNNGDLKYITNINNDESNKKYKIQYTNTKNNSICQIVIGTIDSLMYCIGDKNHTQLDKFQGLVNSIIDGYIIDNNITSINYSGINIKLNKEICLICDETQDLSIDYAKAIIKIMRDRYIDSYIVGDKLQSLVYNDNAFTYLCDNDFSYINKNLYDSTNVCRRFYHSEFINFVNDIVPFNKYSLAPVSSYKNEDDYINPLTIFIGKEIIYTNPSEIKINEEIEEIMKYYNMEVSTNNYKPNDFLIITPFTKNNPLIDALEIAISMYWNKKYNNNKFEWFSVFHKSETGTSIDLSDSDNATRIVSIHTSKGDGRNVVFVIGLEENALRKFSGESNNLLYDSLIHVSFTRMKKKLYIRLINNNDDICKKINNYALKY